MIRVASVLTTLAVACLMGSACDTPTPTALKAVSPSFAKAVTFTNNVKMPLNTVVFIPCAADGAGEVVFMEGSLHSLIHTTVNGNNLTVKTHNQPQGVSGTGLTTGDKYQGTGVTQETFGGSFTNGQYSTSFVNNFRIIGQGPGNNHTVHQTVHFTFNASGELTAYVDNFSAECK